MRITSALAIYLLFWVLSAFLVLPFHGRRADAAAEEGAQVAGQEPGAPPRFRPGRVAGQITMVGTALFLVWFALYTSELVDFGALDLVLRGGDGS